MDPRALDLSKQMAVWDAEITKLIQKFYKTPGGTNDVHVQYTW